MTLLMTVIKAKRPCLVPVPIDCECWDDLCRYSGVAALVGALQINIHGNRDRIQLLDQMDCFVQEVRPKIV